MSMSVAIFTYVMLVVLVSLLLTYYFKFIRPKEEASFKEQSK